jgi:hypothetical protein
MFDSSTPPEQRKAIVKSLIVKCWSDDAFKQALITNPAVTMKAQGLTVPDSVNIKVHQASANNFVLVIPQKPAYMSDEELDAIAGGSWKDFTQEINKILTQMSGMPWW